MARKKPGAGANEVVIATPSSSTAMVLARAPAVPEVHRAEIVEALPEKTLSPCERLKASVAICNHLLSETGEANWRLGKELKKIRDERLFTAAGCFDLDSFVKLTFGFMTADKARSCIKFHERVTLERAKQHGLWKSLSIVSAPDEDQESIWEKADAGATKNQIRKLVMDAKRRAHEKKVREAKAKGEDAPKQNGRPPKKPNPFEHTPFVFPCRSVAFYSELSEMAERRDIFAARVMNCEKDLEASIMIFVDEATGKPVRITVMVRPSHEAAATTDAARDLSAAAE
ncbi:MAG: hypothetical protein KF850_19925 [Labilithrix sp.]|nr:hypothetical protein [Labilithrix sp.]MBX3214313.1 hypothetical protein [Labilithrix sp.]